MNGGLGTAIAPVIQSKNGRRMKDSRRRSFFNDSNRNSYLNNEENGEMKKNEYVVWKERKITQQP